MQKLRDRHVLYLWLHSLLDYEHIMGNICRRWNGVEEVEVSPVAADRQAGGGMSHITRSFHVSQNTLITDPLPMESDTFIFCPTAVCFFFCCCFCFLQTYTFVCVCVLSRINDIHKDFCYVNTTCDLGQVIKASPVTVSHKRVCHWLLHCLSD